MPWDSAEHDSIVKMLAIACELTGTTLSAPAQALLLEELKPYRATGVIRAIQQAMRTCKYRLTLADIRESLSHAPLPAVNEVLKPRELQRHPGSASVKELIAHWSEPPEREP